MRYFGGKTRIAKDVSAIINEIKDEGQVFLSPFVGGGAIEQYVVGEKILCDKHPYLISLYKALQEGWDTPTQLTRDEYNYIKDNQDEKPHSTGFVGFGCSFAGKWFGGYANDKTGRNYCLNAHNSMNKKIKNGLLDNTTFRCCDYTELSPKNKLIYCDPPYENTTQYDKNVVGEFNHELFWDTMREWSKNNTVLISEYNAPSDFKEIWRKETKLDIRNRNNVQEDRIEKLFTFEDVEV